MEENIVKKKIMTGVCIHARNKYACKECNDPIKVTVKRMTSSARVRDKKLEIYDKEKFVGEEGIKKLFDANPELHCQICDEQMQIMKKSSNMCTIRKYNKMAGYISGNCLLACLACK